MGKMLGSPRNRSVHDVDNPWDDDGFYRHRHFKGNRRAGRPTGGRAWRRILRVKEKRAWRDEAERG